ADRRKHEQEHAAEERHHDVVRKHAIEIAWSNRPGEHTVVDDQTGGDHRRGQSGAEEETGPQVVMPEGGRQEHRPAIRLVRFRANLRHRPRDVDAELVRRRILAGVKKLATVVAQVGEIRQIARRKCQAVLHRRKYGAELLAVTARIADGHHVLATYDWVSVRHAA